MVKYVTLSPRTDALTHLDLCARLGVPPWTPNCFTILKAQHRGGFPMARANECSIAMKSHVDNWKNSRTLFHTHDSVSFVF